MVGQWRGDAAVVKKWGHLIACQHTGVNLNVILLIDSSVLLYREGPQGVCSP